MDDERFEGSDDAGAVSPGTSSSEEGADEIVDGELVDEDSIGGYAVGSADDVIGIVISDDRSPSFEEVRFRLRPDAAVSPGQFVVIREEKGEDGPVWVLCRVLDVHEVNPHEDPLSSNIREIIPFASVYAPEGESTVIYRLVRCEPIEEIPVLLGDQAGSPRELRTLPRASSPVQRASGDVVAAAMGFPPDPDDGLETGTLHNSAGVPVVLDKAATQRHICIVGGIGSGKSYTRGVLGEELARLGVPQVNIDVNGEMIHAAKELGGLTVVPGEGFRVPLSSLTRGDLLDAVSGVQKGTQYETLIGYSFDVLQRQIRQGRRSSFTIDELVDEITLQAPNLDMNKPNTLRPAQMRTRSLERIDFIGSQFDWREQLKPGAFINIDCRGLLLEQLRILAAAVARDLQALARQRLIRFTVLSIDEFHLVAPNDDKLVSTQVLREIARIGRHYRLGLILTTQSPSDVDRAILKRMLTRFIHTIEPDQLDALRGVFADAPQEMIRSLPKLPQGTCVLTGVAETVRHAALVDIRTRVTTHGGETPDVWADLRADGWRGKKPLSDLVAEEEGDDD